MPEPAGPGTIAAYLVALDHELVVGLGRRRRILAEVEDHLRTATTAARADGATPRMAEERAITAIGPPHEVASAFRTDLIGIVERAITPMADAADELEARRPRLGKLARDWPPC